MDINELINERNRIETEIRKFDRREIRHEVSDMAKKLEELSQSLSNLQMSLNLAWKRTEQLREDIKNIMDKAS